MVGAAPPALKKLKTTPRVRPSVTLACNPSSSGSTGLTRYLGETTLSFDEDEAAGDVGGVASFPTTQSGMAKTEALEDDRGSGSLAASTQIMANNLFESKSAEEEGGMKCASITQSKAGWTEAEDQMVLLAVRTYGTQWNAVSSQLAGRTADAVRPPYIAQYACYSRRLYTLMRLGQPCEQVRNRWHRLQKRGLSEPSEDSAPCRQLLAAAAVAGGVPSKDQRGLSVASNEGVSCTTAFPVSRAAQSEMTKPNSPPSPKALEPPQLGKVVEKQGGALGAPPQGSRKEVLCLTGSDHGRARWMAYEDELIQDGVKRWGCKWRQIALLLPGRSDSSIRCSMCP